MARHDRKRPQTDRAPSDRGDPDIAATLLLRAAFRDNSSGVVLFSSIHPSRIRSAATTLERFHPSEDLALDAFLHMVDGELRTVPDNERGRS